MASIDHFRINQSVIIRPDNHSVMHQEYQLSARVAVLLLCHVHHLFLILHGLRTSCEVSEHIKIRCAVHQWLFVIPFLHLLLRPCCRDLGSQTLLNHQTWCWCFTMTTVLREFMTLCISPQSKLTLSALFLFSHNRRILPSSHKSFP